MIFRSRSLIGQDHLISGQFVCQDSNRVAVIDDDIIVVVVADGVGSESCSGIASRIAVKESAEYCKKFYADFNNKLDLLNNAFQKALFAIEDHSRASKIPINQLDCTLCAVIFDHGEVYVGNIGDSGAIGLRDDGKYVSLSRQHNDEEGRVYPLAFRSNWEFVHVPGNYVSVLVATDGIFNYLHPIYLSESRLYKDEDPDTHIDYLRVREYIDTQTVGSMSQEEFEAYIDDLIFKVPRTSGPDGTNDDITVVCVVTDEPHGTWQDYESPFDRKELRARYRHAELLREGGKAYYKRRLLNMLTSMSEHADDHIRRRLKFERSGPPELAYAEDRIRRRISELKLERSGHFLATCASGYPDSRKSIAPCDVIDPSIEGLHLAAYISEDTATVGEEAERIVFIRSLIDKRPPPNVIRYCQWPDSYIVVGGRLEWSTEKREYEATLEEMYRNLDDIPISRRAKIAYNLSAMVTEFEKLGYGVGNIEPVNVGITESGGVIFLLGDPLSMSCDDLHPIETDAPKDKRFVRSNSLQGSKMVFSREDGDYMLAQHISWLLFGNSTHTNPETAGEFHVESNMDMKAWFPEYLVDRFFDIIDERCIPTGMDWKYAMEHYSVDVQRCKKNKGHVYYVCSPECPYCVTNVNPSDSKNS